jgi:arylsulfatase A
MGGGNSWLTSAFLDNRGPVIDMLRDLTLRCGIALFALSISLTTSAAETPNIVVILADDLGYGDLACYNPHSKIPTPQIDALAKAGMRFTNAYSAAAVCVPSRYSLMTGRYPFRGAPLRWGTHPTIKDGRATVASLLKSRGYETACVGKWHCGFNGGVKDQTKPLTGGPRDRGFDHFFGQHGSLDQPPYFYIRDRRAVQPATIPIAESHEEGLSIIYQGRFWRAGKVAPNFKHEEVLERYAGEAMSFLEDHHRRAAKKPFFLYCALTAPHGPWLPAKQFAGKSKAGTMGDFVVHVDDVVGRLLLTLKELQYDKNTLVLFSSDNGPLWFDPDVKHFGHDSSGGLRGRKGDVWEGGIRMPLIARWPGKVPRGSTTDEIAGLVDVLATCAAVVGKKLPTDAGVDSVSLLPVILDEPRDKPVRDSIVLQSLGPKDLAIRQGDWKYIPWIGSGGFLTKPKRVKPAAGEATGQLYNLKNDPGEQKNLFLDHPEIVARLAKQLQQQRGSTRTRR